MTKAQVTRQYIDSRFGQSHIYVAGGSDHSNHPALVCCHMSPWSAASLEPLIGEMGQDRLAVAIDTPGYGNSDGPGETPEIKDYAAAIGDVVETLGIRQMDLYGERTGAKIALEFARQQPNLVRRMTLVSPVIWTDAERVARKVYPPEKIHADGSHLRSYWQISVGLSMPGRTLAMIARTFYSRLLNNKNAHLGRRAAARYNARQTLENLNKPIMVLRPRDDLWQFAERVKPLLINPQSYVHELPEWGFGFLDVKAAETASILRAFNDQRA